jgi:ankyrin repeat protein
LLLVRAEASTRGVNATNQFGESELHVACKRKDVERIRALLRDGADLAAVDKSAWTVLHQAVESCNPDVVRAILGTRSTCCLGRAREGVLWLTLLRAMTAAGGEAGRNGRIDIEHRTSTGLSALHMAVENNDPEIVAMLVAHGADPAAQTAAGESALDLCMAMEARGCIGALTLGPGARRN